MTFLKAKQDVLATVNVRANKPSIAFIPDTLRKIDLLTGRDAVVSRKIKFSVGPSLKTGMNFLVNNDMHINDKPVLAGDLQVWEIRNTSLMDHPFHLHGAFFQVIEENAKALEFRAWKDTYNLTPRSKIKIAWVPDNHPGTWMYHCHILEHHKAGMMANFDVVLPADSGIGTQELKTEAAHHLHHH